MTNKEITSFDFFNLTIELLLVFFIVFGVFFYESNKILKYSDELFVGILALIALFFKTKVLAAYYKQILIFMLMLFMYIAYSIQLGLNNSSSIFSDFIVETKAFIVFFILYATGFRIKKNILFRLIALILAFTLFFVGIIGETAIKIIFSHYERFYSAAIILTLLYLSSYRCLFKQNLIISILIISLGLISLKAKFFGEYVLFIVLLFYTYFSFYNKRIKLSRSVKNLVLLLFIPLILTIVWFLTKDKIIFYFITGTENTNNMFARPALYITGVQIFMDYFPLGSGFASFGSYYSAAFGYSQIYEVYNLANLQGLTPSDPRFVADTYFPMIIGQFGFIGTVFLLYFFYFIYKKSSFLFRLSYQQNAISYLIIIFILLVFVIESVADATIAQNRGIMYMILLAININKLKIAITKGKA